MDSEQQEQRVGVPAADSDELTVTEQQPGGDIDIPHQTGGDKEKDETDIESASRSSAANVEVEQGQDRAEQGDKDPDLVDWDGPDDPENPMNWPVQRKWVVTMVLAWTCVWVTFASSVFSQATMVTAQEFGVSTEVMTLGTSLLLFGYMLGPLIWAPMSELYGRRLPLFLGYSVFIIFQIPVAVARNVETIMLARFLQGVFGCAPLSVVGGAFADFWDPVNRAVAIALFASATFLGPIFGPIMYVSFFVPYY